MLKLPGWWEPRPFQQSDVSDLSHKLTAITNGGAEVRRYFGANAKGPYLGRVAMTPVGAEARTV